MEAVGTTEGPHVNHLVLVVLCAVLLRGQLKGQRQCGEQSQRDNARPCFAIHVLLLCSFLPSAGFRAMPRSTLPVGKDNIRHCLEPPSALESASDGLFQIGSFPTPRTLTGRRFRSPSQVLEKFWGKSCRPYE